MRERGGEREEVEFFFLFRSSDRTNEFKGRKNLYHASRQRVGPRGVEGDAENRALMALEQARGVGRQSMGGVRVGGHRTHCSR